MIARFKNIINNFDLHSHKVVQFASFVAFVISAIFTILLMTSQCYSWISIILTFGMAVLLEYGKSYFFTKSLNGKNYKIVIRIMFLVVSLCLFVSSIIASLSFLANEINRVLEPERQVNSEILKQKDVIKSKESILNDKRIALEEYKKTSQKLITDEKSNLSSIPKDYYDYVNSRNYTDIQRDGADKVNKMANDRTAGINKRDAGIEALTNEINGLKNKVKINAADNVGYSAFIKQIVDKLNKNKKSNLWTVDSAMTVLLSILSILFEIIAVLLYYTASTDRKNEEGKVSVTCSFKKLKPIEIDVNGDKEFTYAKFKKPQKADSTKTDKEFKVYRNEYNDNVTLTNTEFSNLKIGETLIQPKDAGDYKRNNIGFKPNLELSNPCTFDSTKTDIDFDSGIVPKDIHFEITLEKLKKYILFVQEYVSDDGICPSNALVIKETGLKQAEIRTIKNVLKANGVIDVDEQKKRTILLRMPDDSELDLWGWR